MSLVEQCLDHRQDAVCANFGRAALTEAVAADLGLGGAIPIILECDVEVGSSLSRARVTALIGRSKAAWAREPLRRSATINSMASAWLEAVNKHQKDRMFQWS
jgi:hypothetical protein